MYAFSYIQIHINIKLIVELYCKTFWFSMIITFKYTNINIKLIVELYYIFKYIYNLLVYNVNNLKP